MKKPQSALCHASAHVPVRNERPPSRRPPGVTGSVFETRALEFLLRQQLTCVARNVRCRGGELDLVMRDTDGTLVFVEVRARGHLQYGGAAASISWRKQQRLLLAAGHFLAASSLASCACRFDVVAFEGGRLAWLRDAFRADDG